ncbi:hypothetical protein [Caballeronia sp. 15711]|uniref:hypothetical protein n=1 Tax=Caballeronia sp. 15711 TaxID=3391029 RepID=UPI0039E46866
MTTDIEKTPDTTPPDDRPAEKRTLHVTGTLFKDAKERGAVIATSPVIRAGMTGIEFAEKGGFGKELDLSEFSKRIRLQAEAVNKGDMTGPEQMLVSQAATLDAIFNTLARKAATAEFMPQVEANLRLALKAQGQCAQTLRVLGDLKNPRAVTFAKQVNNANGPQQVNNGSVSNGNGAHPPMAEVPVARTHGENKDHSNKLLSTDHEHGTTLDAGGAGEAGRVNSNLAAVEAFNRTEE